MIKMVGCPEEKEFKFCSVAHQSEPDMTSKFQRHGYFLHALEQDENQKYMFDNVSKEYLDKHKESIVGAFKRLIMASDYPLSPVVGSKYKEYNYPFWC
jgi:hypothetical protein